MYADDIILLSKSAKGLQEKLDIHVLNTYCKDWCLTVNTSKTKILIFNKAGRLLVLIFGLSDSRSFFNLKNAFRDFLYNLF
jgi:hypothetical protein